MTTQHSFRPLRSKVLLGLARLSALVLTALVVFRLVVPYLIDLHSDLGLICAVGAGLGGFAVLIWLAFDFTTTLRANPRT